MVPPESSTARLCDVESSDIVTTTIFSSNSSSGGDVQLNAAYNNKRATQKEKDLIAAISWRRIMLLIVAVTVHNIPEGLAVGVAFGSIGKAPKATFESAFNLALGIGLQNFPEGLAVSLPLAAFGHSKFKSFIYGQLSGKYIACSLGNSRRGFPEVWGVLREEGGIA
ncbi:unnamed protein product [Anisakis simplex]|uniref:Zinc transporter ZIP11 n=1 Tax=Anisakis simplex TaxID=6269 RepID=A0A0M3J9N9_ANISI|nr:unnamed protein product [Anisakis simplex]